MKKATESAAKLRSLLKKHKPAADALRVEALSPLERLVHSALLWEAGARQADMAYARLMKHVVDFNDLRVTDTRELASVIGVRYPAAADRLQMLRQVLQAIYQREHEVRLAHLLEMPKREARTYLETLEGMVPFVAASVLLLSLGGHAVPVDQPLLKRLTASGVLAPDATLEQAQAFLEHQIKATEALEAFLTLRRFVETTPEPAAPKRKETSARPKRTASKSTKHKSTSAAKPTKTKPAGKPSTKPARGKGKAAPKRSTAKKTGGGGKPTRRKK